MRSIGREPTLIVVAAVAALTIGCAQPTPAPRSIPPDSASALSIFADTAAYRRHCEVPAGQSVDLRRPCLLLDQGRPPGVRPPPPRP